MAEVSQRSWKLPGQRSKRLAWGFTVTVTGKRVRQYRSEWTKQEAEEALAKARLGLEQETRESHAVIMRPRPLRWADEGPKSRDSFGRQVGATSDPKAIRREWRREIEDGEEVWSS